MYRVHEPPGVARQIAERFDVRFGALKNASADSHAVQPLRMEAMALRSAAADSFAPGEMTVRRQVQATFAPAERQRQLNG